MAIKRLTIELDDSEDSKTITTTPDSLAENKTPVDKKNKLTNIPDYNDEVGTESFMDSKKTAITIGRTFPDLISEFVNNPRAMATTLFFLPFILFVNKIDDIDSFKFPLITGAILNFVWFVVPIIIGFWRWIINKLSAKS